MSTNGMPESELKHVILQDYMVEGVVIHASQVPSEADVELIVVDEEVYTEPMLDCTREDLAPYEKCKTCGCVKSEHLDGVGRNLWNHEEWNHEECNRSEAEPTGKTPAGDRLDEWEER